MLIVWNFCLFVRKDYWRNLPFTIVIFGSFLLRVFGEVDVPERPQEMSYFAYVFIFYLPVLVLGWFVASVFSLLVFYCVWYSAARKEAVHLGLATSEIIRRGIDENAYERYLNIRKSIFRWR